VILDTPSDPSLEGVEIEFTGEGHSPSELTRFVWNSSIDGVIHDDLDANFRSDSLSVGTHTISFKAQGTDGNWSDEVTTTLTIVMNPIAEIVPGSPSPNPATTSDLITLKGNGTVSGSISRFVWSSDLDGVLYNGTEQEIEKSNLTMGNHTIFLRIMDDHGFWSDEAFTQLWVTERPTTAIDMITPNPALTGEEILFYGNATSVDPIINYSWSSDLYGLLYMGHVHTYSTTDLSLGDHTISFRAMSNLGFWSDPDTMTVIVHTTPEVGITGVTPDPAYTGETVEFSSNAIDDGIIVRYVWSSSLSGTLYDGENPGFTTTFNVNGTHTISLKVRDDQGVWGYATPTTIEVRSYPKASIISITPSFATENEMIHFTGSEEPHIEGYSWHSSIDGEFFNGTEAEMSSS